MLNTALHWSNPTWRHRNLPMHTIIVSVHPVISYYFADSRTQCRKKGGRPWLGRNQSVPLSVRKIMEAPTLSATQTVSLAPGAVIGFVCPLQRDMPGKTVTQQHPVVATDSGRPSVRTSGVFVSKSATKCARESFGKVVKATAHLSIPIGRPRGSGSFFWRCFGVLFHFH